VDVSYPAEVESFRTEVQAVLAEELPPGWPGIGAIAGREDAERFAAQWRQTLYRRGLLGLTWPPAYSGRGLSRLHQVVLMEELARILTQVHKGTDLGAAASVAKLYWSEYHVAATELALDIQGLDGLVPQGRGPLRTVRTDDPGAPNSSGSWLGAFLNARAGTIYAGISEVQRNILAETVLGLPKERREPKERSEHG
jgi:alkylation response protein AidB-like acyl-CoA dehydrogenase